MANDEVKVLFGGDTSGLDQATERASSDIEGFEGSVNGLMGKLQQLAQSIRNGFNFEGMQSGLQGITGAGRGASGVMGELGNAAMGAGLLLAGCTVAAVAASRAVLDWASHHAQVAQELSNLSQQLGMSVTDISSWSAVLASSGISQGTFVTGVEQLSRNLAQARSGVTAQANAFQALGIDINQTMTQSELLLQVADRFRSMPDGPEKTAIAMQVLGRSGADLIPILNQGSEALRGQMDAAVESGAAVGDAYVEAGLLVDNALSSMNQQAQGFANTLFAELGPSIANIIQGFTDWVGDIGETAEASGMLDGILRVLKAVIAEIALVVGTAGLVISHVLTAAIVVAIPAVELLKTSIISLTRAFQGDFEGAARAWSEGVDRAVNEMQRQVEHAQQVQGRYNNWAMQQLGLRQPDAQARGPAPDAEGDAAIARIREQQQQAEERRREAAERRARAAADRATREARRQAEERLRAATATLDAEMEANRNNYEAVMRLEEQKLSLLREFYGEDSRQYQAELRRKEQMERQHAQLLQQIERDRLESQRRIAEITLETDNTIARQRIELERARVEQMRSLGTITEQEKIARLATINQQIIALEAQSEQRQFELRMASLRAQLEAEDMRVQDRERILRQIEELEAGHAARLREIQAQSADATARSQMEAASATAEGWRNRLQPVGQALNGMFQNLYNGTMTFKQAVLQAADQMLFAFVQKGIEMAVNWAANQMAMTAATTAGVATRTAAEQAGAAAGMATSGTMSLGQIMNSAFTAMAGAYSAIASIPYIGPFLAPVVAAGVFAAVAGLAGSVVSSRGGLGRVEKDGQMAELHKDETVLPANLATPLRDMLRDYQPQRNSTGMLAQASAASGGGSSYVGGDTNLYYQPSNQLTNGNLEQMLKRDSLGLRRWMKNEARNGRIK